MEISFPKVFSTLLQLVLLHQFIFFFNDDGNTFLVIRIYYIFITIFRANCLLLFYTTRFDSLLRQHAYVFSVAYVSLFCFLFLFHNVPLHFSFYPFTCIHVFSTCCVRPCDVFFTMTAHMYCCYVFAVI